MRASSIIVALLLSVLIQWYPVNAAYSRSDLTVTPIKLTGMPQLSTPVRVYILEIPEVPTSVENTTSLQEGISWVAGVQNFGIYGGLVHGIYGNIIHVAFNVTTLTSWEGYKDLILTGENFIIINSHGEYLPVPTGYSSSQWFSNVLDAISNRSNIWVHVGGFPFYYAWTEGIGSSIFGTSPFQQLVSLAGLPPAVSSTPDIKYEQTLDAYDTESAMFPDLLFPYQWVHSAGPVLELPSHSSFDPSERSVDPFNPSYRDFYSTLFPSNYTYPAAAATFRVNGTSEDSYGLYSHYVGTTVSNTPSDGYPLVRGIISLLMPISWEVLETGSSMLYALNQISYDQSQGRIVGLLSAANFLSTAESEFRAGRDLSAWLDSYKAISASLAATLPPPFSYLAPYWLYFAIFALIVLGGFALGQAGIVSAFLSKILGRPGSIKGIASKQSVL